MTVTAALNRCYQLATGKNTALAVTDAKGAKILNLFNHYTSDWAKSDWAAMRSTFTLTPTITATDTFSFSASTTLHHISQQEGDFVRIYHTDGVGETDYTIVPIDRLYDNGPARNNAGGMRVAISGTSLVFPTAFLTTNPQYGGSIRVPGYLAPTTLAGGTDVIQVSDPLWLVQRSAAQYVLTDRTRVQLYDTLKGEADKLWAEMIGNEESQHETIYTAQLMPSSGGAFD